jgi:hypothetical protein
MQLDVVRHEEDRRLHRGRALCREGGNVGPPRPRDLRIESVAAAIEATRQTKPCARRCTTCTRSVYAL